jgi:diacylglycerol kinase family enzyme
MATNLLIDLLSDYRRNRTWRRIALMDCGERWGVFTAGMGVDGEVVAAVEARRRKHKGVTAMRYISSAVPTMLRSARREPTLTLQVGDREPAPGVHFVFVSNASPWTYVNTRPVWTNPDCTFETGLGVFATTSMSVWRNLALLRQMLAKRPKLEAKHLIRDDDADFVRVTADTPVATQIDGDYIGTRAEMTFKAVPQALAVVAPPRKEPPDLQR